MNSNKIVLISFGYFEQNLLDEVTGAISVELGIQVTVKDGHLDLSEFYDAARRQYNATMLLKRIVTDFSDPGMKTVGLFSVDLFIPILTFIFGQAYLNGDAAVVSAYRLSNERYGLPPDETLFRERLVKEVMHELGHMLGLVHCTNPECVMRSSTYVEEIDQKLISCCPSCRSKAGY